MEKELAVSKSPRETPTGALANANTHDCECLCLNTSEGGGRREDNLGVVGLVLA